MLKPSTEKINVLEASQNQKPTTELEEAILWASMATAFALLLLPYENTNEKPLPAIIFKGRPSSFHAFILALNFALFGSFLAISLRRSYPRIARCCLTLAIISLAIGIGIPLWLIFPRSF
ncbi:hypothetical protein L484_026514 [Morus notabilis]|uniref:Uncharacterized protein n=1 Tax=Morus notabilis TaxID=981085 RepID=W9QP39_9ROSA|nr:hypothetical protein L484_026514 [Morus notabilis]